MSITATVENGTIKLPVHVPDGTQVEITVPAVATLESAAPGGEDELPTLYERLKEFVGIIKDGPTDMAAEHDHYAHGTPKQVPGTAIAQASSSKTDAPQEVDNPTILGRYAWLNEFVGCIKDGPADMAAEHDHYAHGTPKRGAQ